MSELGQKIIAETRKVAADNPLYVYEKRKGACTYIRDGQPSCIIGHALWNLKMIDADFGGDALSDSSIGNVLKSEEWDVESEEAEWLSEVQNSQDNGYAWGSSISRADDPEWVDEDV